MQCARTGASFIIYNDISITYREPWCLRCHKNGSKSKVTAKYGIAVELLLDLYSLIIVEAGTIFRQLHNSGVRCNIGFYSKSSNNAENNNTLCTHTHKLLVVLLLGEKKRDVCELAEFFYFILSLRVHQNIMPRLLQTWPELVSHFVGLIHLSLLLKRIKSVKNARVKIFRTLRHTKNGGQFNGCQMACCLFPMQLVWSAVRCIQPRSNYLAMRSPIFL